jgi:hypothetical protein
MWLIKGALLGSAIYVIFLFVVVSGRSAAYQRRSLSFGWFSGRSFLRVLRSVYLFTALFPEFSNGVRQSISGMTLVPLVSGHDHLARTKAVQT